MSEETKEYIRKEAVESNKENTKLWGSHIQCHFIPYKPARKPLANLKAKPATASAIVADFSMKYQAQQTFSNNQISSAKPVQESKVHFMRIT